MKRISLLFAFIWCSLGAFAQINMCTVPVSNTYFQREYGTISTTTNNISKLSYAITLATNNCLSASQVKQVTLLFYTDQDKLEFCKNAYKNTVDKENFYDVFDAFAYFSTVFRLHDYVMAQGMQNNNNTVIVTTTTNNQVPNYPLYTYPDYTNYYGITGCNYPMDETSFGNTYNTYFMSKMNEASKVTVFKDYINMNCLSTSQIMRLTSILTIESNRLDVLKTAYPRAYDRGNYGYADQLFTNSSYKLDFDNFLRGNNTTTTTTTVVTNTNTCVVTSNDMNDIKNSIKNATFENSMITTSKQIISAKKCFTVAQIKEILELFSFESSKLDVAKYAYDYCIVKSNYYQVNDVFTFPCNKDDLTRYVQGR